MTSAMDVYRKMFDFSMFAGMNMKEILYSLGEFASYNAYTILILIIAMAIAFFAKNTREITEDFSLKYRHAVVIGVLLVISLLQMTIVSDFLYFQF